MNTTQKPAGEKQWNRGASVDLWRHTLSQIPSLFGRMVYLSSLRNANTARYEHHGLAAVFSPEEADDTLRGSHEQTFASWLALSLPERKADFEQYLEELAEDRYALVSAWLRLTPYQNYVPASALAGERKLYANEMETLLGLLKGELGVSDPNRDA